MTLHQGDCIKLRSGEGPFQVIGIDDDHDRCWIRQWPLDPHGCPVFEVALEADLQPFRRSVLRTAGPLGR